MCRCTVFGAVRAFDAEGRRLALASKAQRRLLAMLCLRAGSTARAVVLEEHLGLSAGALRTSVSRLRRVLGADVLQSGPAGYELRAEVDALEYERLVLEAFSADSAHALRCLDRAASLWQGSPFEEFADEQWVEVEASRLLELHAAAMEELAVLLLDAGEHTAAIAVVLPLIDEQPYRDLPRALMMRALAAAGRRTEALRAFQDYRTLLQTDIGTEPSAPLVELDRSIAAGVDLDRLRLQGHPAWERRRGHRPVTTSPRPPSVPAALSSFVGRANELAELVALLSSHRLLTITGSGGAGKSRLAMRMAATAPERDGAEAWWVELGVVESSGNVADQIAAELGLLPGSHVVAELGDRFRGRRVLLVLDNAEHVVDSTVEVLTALLASCPDLTALVTSRQPLGLAGEVVWRVPELSQPGDLEPVTLDNFDRYDALRLFVVRAREARPGMVLSRKTLDLITSICRELDGMPLAIELAAARLRSVPLATISDGINEVIAWRVGDRAKPPRHATLRTSIEWSVGLVSDAEQRALVSLSVFRSPFDVDAAAAVLGAVMDDGPADRGSVADCLARLTDVGLLQFDGHGGRYRMLTIVQQYCVDRGEASGLIERAEAAHAAHVAAWCEAVGDGRLGIEHHRFVRRMPDVVAASTWARGHDERSTLYAICRGLAPVRSALGYYADFVANWRWLLAVDPSERDPAWAEAVSALMATATSQLFDTASAVEAARVHIGEASGRAGAWLRRGVAMVPAYQGRTAAIHAYAEELLLGRNDLEASVYVGFAAYMEALLGRLDLAEPLLEDLRHLTRRHGCAFSVDSVGNGFAAAIIADTIRGDLAAATDRSRRRVPTDPAFSITSAAALAHAALLAADHGTMRRAIEWGTRRSFPLLGFLTPWVGCCAAALRHDEQAAADLAIEFVETVTVPVWHLFALPTLNSALVSAGRVGDAARITIAAEPFVDSMGPAPLPLVSLDIARAQLALAADEPGGHAAAERHALAALTTAQAHGLPLASVDALDVMAVVLARTGDPASERVAGAVAAERRRLGHRFAMATFEVTPAPSEVADRPHVAEVIGELLGRGGK